VAVTTIVQSPLVVVAAFVKVTEFEKKNPAPVLVAKSCGLGALKRAVRPVPAGGGVIVTAYETVVCPGPIPPLNWNGPYPFMSVVVIVTAGIAVRGKAFPKKDGDVVDIRRKG
jgi:hypothetical protein